MKSVAHIALFLLLGLVAVFPLAAQEDGASAPEGSIEWVVRSFLKAKSFPDRQRYYTGEMRLMGGRSTPGAAFADSNYDLEIRVNEQDDDSAVVAATMVDTKSNQRSDFYLFLVREDEVWKLTAVRNFSPPRGMGQMYAALAAKGKNIDARDLRELNVLQVLQFNDWGVKQTFPPRRELMEEIAAELLRRGITEVIHGGQPNTRVGKELSEKVRNSMMNYVQLHENGVIEFNAAAFGQSAVGFLWVHATSNPPPASPENYILVEPLDGPWYLYRRQ